MKEKRNQSKNETRQQPVLQASDLHTRHEMKPQPTDEKIRLPLECLLMAVTHHRQGEFLPVQLIIHMGSFHSTLLRYPHNQSWQSTVSLLTI